MAGVDELRHILQHIIYGQDDASFTQHHLVIERHETLFHIRAQACHNMYSVIPEMSKRDCDIYPLVGVKFAEHLVSQRINHIIVTVVYIGACQYEVDQFPFSLHSRCSLKPTYHPIVLLPLAAISLKTFMLNWRLL